MENGSLFHFFLWVIAFWGLFLFFDAWNTLLVPMCRTFAYWVDSLTTSKNDHELAEFMPKGSFERQAWEFEQQFQKNLAKNLKALEKGQKPQPTLRTKLIKDGFSAEYLDRPEVRAALKAKGFDIGEDDEILPRGQQ